MNGKGRGPMKGYNHQKYAENYDQIFRTMKTNQETKPMTPNQPTATATPRTDALRRRVPIVALRAHQCLDHADTLERELSSAQAALAEAKMEVALAKDDATHQVSVIARLDTDNATLRAMLAKCTPLDVSERAELGNLRDREEISKATNDQLRARVAELEQDKARLITQTCDSIRDILRKRSAGEVNTWGFVAMFMEMIDEAQRAAIDAAKGAKKSL